MNATLKSLLLKWNQAFSKLNTVLGSMDQTAALGATEDTLQEYCKEILRATMKMSSLCQCISSTSDSRGGSSYESFEQVLSKGGLGNLFEQYWSRVVHILNKSLSTMRTKPDYKRVFESIVQRFPVFQYNLNIVWQMYLREIASPEETEQYKSVVVVTARYKENLLGSIQLVKEEYVKMVEGKVENDYEEIVLNFEGYAKVIEKLEKVEKIDLLQSVTRKLIEDLSAYLKDTKGQQQEIVEIVRMK